MKRVKPLIFMISSMFLLGGFAGIFGSNPKLGTIYAALGLVGCVYSFRDTWCRP